MLKQLARLSVDVEGRYATDKELQFLEAYLESVKDRLSAYEKIRDNEEQIIHRWEAQKRSRNENLFELNGKDITEICRRDMTNMLRCSATFMLFDDLDRLQDGLLLWYKTIVKSFGYTKYAQINYLLIQDVIKLYLSAEEAALMLPVLQLDRAVLGAA
ncbi:MAG: allophycocyanin [Hydrococcus sp. C42_A2020_068]|uniref:phycobilisome protein n=1 Tax=Pleurocapsa sp. PCC 7327 TaxID=118163 RepID=UPI00029F9FD5|nr:phycobilisome protein [Pleurocapsa sp. PCC 7327]AFY76285.1 Phycobilisome protein [Pleurocapsa sp. PCC 7327]MBF2018906.1 allophycocyanin [Hydrococcus sp. C42_A2020_068]